MGKSRLVGARARVDGGKLDQANMLSSFLRALPKRNNFGVINFAELLDEANHFGVRTKKQFRLILLRHRCALLQADRESLDAVHIAIYRQELGDEVMADRLRRQRWFSWEALTRIAFELEFAEAYIEFAAARDGFY
jgi:hypothetical protein